MMFIFRPGLAESVTDDVYDWWKLSSMPRKNAMKFKCISENSI